MGCGLVAGAAGKHLQTDTDTDTDTDTHTDRPTDTHTYRHKDIRTHIHTDMNDLNSSTCAFLCEHATPHKISTRTEKTERTKDKTLT